MPAASWERSLAAWAALGPHAHPRRHLPWPSGSAHPAVRLGDDHTMWSSTQPEDGSHAAAAATLRCSLPLGPTAQPPATGAPHAGLACLVAQRASVAAAARTQPGGRGPPATSQ